jgi:expansin (peptidoglycan-binding protein)
MRPSSHRRVPALSPRWLAAGGTVVLAAVIGVTLLLVQNGGPACAAPPATSAKSGQATYYDLAGGTGNCSFKAPADDLFVALGPDQYSSAAACGTYLDVTGPKGSVRVKVIDKCPECATGHLDLSRTAFKKIGTESAGIIPITYRTVVNPSVPAAISVRIKEGSSQYWFAALFDNHANQLASVTVGGRSAHRTDYNYWLIDGGAGSGPFTIKLTDVNGRVATLTGITLSPEKTQQTSVRFGGTSVAKAAPVAARTTTAPVKKRSATPSPSTSSRAATSRPATSAAAVVAVPEAATVTGTPAGTTLQLADAPASRCH